MKDQCGGRVSPLKCQRCRGVKHTCLVPVPTHEADRGSTGIESEPLNALGWKGPSKSPSKSNAPCHGQGLLQLNQAAQIPDQPHFDWRRDIHSFPGQPVLMSQHPLCKECLCYVQSKSALFQFLTVAPHLVTTG